MRLTLIILIPIFVTLSGCSGWHLRGLQDNEVVDLRVFISFPRADQFGRALQRKIIERGGVLAGEDKANFIVDIFYERFEKKLLSIDPRTGKVRELELRLEAEISVREKGGHLLIPKQVVQYERDYFFDELSAGFTTSQQSILERDLAEEAATAIIYRMIAVSEREN